MGEIKFKKEINALKFINRPIEYDRAFSRGIKIDLGICSLLFISGTASIGENGETLYPGDFLAQTKRTFDNLTTLLQSEDVGWQDVVQTRCYLKDMRNYEKFNVFRTRFYKKQKLQLFPASVCIEANLCRPKLLIEIEAIAITQNRRPKYD